MEGGRGGAPDRRDLLKLLGGTATSYVVGGFRGDELSEFGSQGRGLDADQDHPRQWLTASAWQTEMDPWSQQAKLVAADGDSEDSFGRSLAVSDDGTTAIIGAPWDEDPNGEYSGSAYVFEESDGTWSRGAKLDPDDGDSGDIFGGSVAVSGDGTTAIVGADSEDNPNGDAAGSAYVFEESGTGWTQQAKLTAEDGDSRDSFGWSVAVSADGTTVIVGAYNDVDPNGDFAGSAYVFNDTGDTWTQEAKLAAEDGNREDFFGWSVAVSSDGTTAIVGADQDEDPNGEEAGSAYVFQESDGIWSQQAKLAAADGDRYDSFGNSVAISGDGTTVIVGASNDEDPNGATGVDYGGAGSAYVFEQSGGWSQSAKLTATDGDPADGFGGSVAVLGDGKAAVVGAWGDEDPNGDASGSAYVFEESSGAWSQQAKLAAADGDSGDNFGGSVAVSGDGTTAIVGADEDEDPNGFGAGSAYVFDQSSTTAEPNIQISSVTVDQPIIESGDTIELSATVSNTGGAQGTADVEVEFTEGDNTERSVTVPPGGSETVEFTRTIEQSPGEYTLTLRVTDTDGDVLTRDQTITVEESTGSWSQRAKIAPDDGDSEDWFGNPALSGDGSTLLVGAYGDEDPNGEAAGAAYVFRWTGSSWDQQAKLAAADGDSDDRFGVAVAINDDGSTAIVGARGDERSIGGNTGSAYVFTSSGGSWSQEAKLVADDGDTEDWFGTSVAIDAGGSTALVGAPVDEDPNGESAGSAYVFESSGNSWDQQAKLTPADGAAQDTFGFPVTLADDGRTALIGAWRDDNSNGENAGAAYVFERSGDSWIQQAKLTPANGASGAGFGESVAISSDGSMALLGAPGDGNDRGTDVKSAYVFEQSNSSWSQQAKLTPEDGATEQWFGQSVAMADSGSTVLVGANETPDGDVGSSYVFTRTGTSWSQEAKLTPADGGRNSVFGIQVEMSSDGSISFVGAPLDDDPNGEDAGSVYVFEKATTTSGPEISVTSFTIDQTTIESGDTIELTATISNTGDAQGTADIGVDVSGSGGGGRRSVTVPPGGSETVEFTRAIEQSPGEYTVTLRVTNTDGTQISVSTRERTITVEEDALAQIKEAHRSTAQAVEDAAVSDLFAVDYARTANREFTEAVERGELSEEQAFAALQRLNEGIATTETVLDHIGPEPEFSGEDRTNLAKEMALPTLKTAISLVMAGSAAAQKANQSDSTQTKRLAATAKKKAADGAKGLIKSMIGQAADVSGRVKVESSRLVEDLLNNGFETASDVQSAIEAAAEVIADTVADSLREYSEQGILAVAPELPGTTFGESPVALDFGVDLLYELLSADSVAGSGLSGSTEGAVSAAATARSDIRSQAERSQDLIRDAESFVSDFDIAEALIELVDNPNRGTAIKTVISLVVTLAGGIFDAFATGAGVQGLINMNIDHQVGLASIVQGETR